MKNEKNIEKVIIEKFAEQEFDIEQAWLNNMSDSLDEFNEKRRKKRIIFWWFLTGGIILGATLVSSELLFPKNQANVKHASTERVIQTQKNTSSKETTTPNNQVLVESQENHEGDISKAIKKERASESTDISFIQTKKQLAEESSKSPSSEENKKPPLNTEKEFGLLSKEPKKINIKSSIPFTLENRIGEQDQKNNTIDVLGLKDPELLTFAVDEHPILLQESMENAPESNAFSKWSVGLTAGPSFTSRSLTLPTNNAYSTARKEFEKGRINWNADLELSRRLGRFHVFSGVSLASFGENVQYEAIATTTDGFVNTITDVSYWDYDSTFIQGQWVIDDSTWTIDFDTVQVPGTVTAYDSSILAANGKTQYSYFEFPIGVGFKLVEHKRLQLSATLGLSVGIRVKQKGNYLLNGGGITSAQSNKISLNSMYGLDFRYYVTEKSSLSLRPTLKLNHMNNSDLEGIKRRYSSWGLKIGWFMDL